MIAYLVLVFAVLSRLLPHAFGLVGLNFTAVGGSLLFFGAKRGRWQTAVAVAALMGTDWYLTTAVYGYAFHVSGYLLTWAWYAGVCLLGHEALRGRPGFGRVAGAAGGAATSFFVMSNFAVWVASGMYPHSLAGLGACYVAAIPFYANDLISTGLTVGAFWGVPALARSVVRDVREVGLRAA